MKLAGARPPKFVLIGVAGTGGGICVLDDLGLSLTTKRVEAAKFAANDPTSPVTAASGTNLARGQVVRCSSFWENGFECERAVDGNLANDNYGKGAAWHSQRPGKDQWLKMYFPKTYRISRIRMLNSSAQAAYRTREYRIEVSSDDREYRKIAAGTLPDDGTTWTEVKFPTTAARYLRFVGVTSYNLDYAVGLKEIEVYSE